MTSSYRRDRTDTLRASNAAALSLRIANGQRLEGAARVAAVTSTFHTRCIICSFLALQGRHVDDKLLAIVHHSREAWNRLQERLMGTTTSRQQGPSGVLGRACDGAGRNHHVASENECVRQYFTWNTGQHEVLLM